jgi:hypothetical protein
MAAHPYQRLQTHPFYLERLRIAPVYDSSMSRTQKPAIPHEQSAVSFTKKVASILTGTE